MVPRNSEDLVLKERLLHLDIFSILETECEPSVCSTFFSPQFFLLGRTRF